MPQLLFRLKPKVGSHTMLTKEGMIRLKPGDEIRCEKDLLGNALDKFEQMEPDSPSPEPSVGLRAVHRGHGRWDVVNQVTGKAINDKALKRDEALEMASKGLPEEKETTGAENLQSPEPGKRDVPEDDAEE